MTHPNEDAEAAQRYREQEGINDWYVKPTFLAGAKHGREQERKEWAEERDRLRSALIMAKNAFEKNWAIDWNIIDEALEKK